MTLVERKSYYHLYTSKIFQGASLKELIRLVLMKLVKYSSNQQRRNKRFPLNFKGKLRIGISDSETHRDYDPGNDVKIRKRLSKFWTFILETSKLFSSLLTEYFTTFQEMLKKLMFCKVGISFQAPESLGFQQVLTDAETKYSKEPLHTLVTTSVPKGKRIIFPSFHPRLLYNQ